MLSQKLICKGLAGLGFVLEVPGQGFGIEDQTSYLGYFLECSEQAAAGMPETLWRQQVVAAELLQSSLSTGIEAAYKQMSDYFTAFYSLYCCSEGLSLLQIRMDFPRAGE